ncbi:MAG: HD domain-containing phosphohydrolase [Acidobacteriaceae bacterium]
MATSSLFRSSGRASPRTQVAGRVALFLHDAAAAAAIRQILEEQNFSVLTAKSAAALRSIAGTPASSAIDVVLLDLGAHAAEQEDSDQPSAPMILLADAEHVAEASHAVEAGAYDLLIQPISDRQLLIAVRRAMEHRRLQVQNDLFRHHLEQLIAARTQMLQNTMHQLEQSYDVTLEALGNALDLKDAETEGHSKRVTAYTLALGRAVGLNEAQLRVVGRGAFLHDIGKMAIPDAILRKPGKLTQAERAIVRTHSELGYQMVQKIPFLRESAEIVYAHQECFDGSGYPRGLRGEQIHIGARIFAVADTLDAITSNRPYRKASPIAAARKEVLRCAGTQFDPAIVDVFLATPESIWRDLREGILRDGPEFSPFGYTFGEIS